MNFERNPSDDNNIGMYVRVHQIYYGLFVLNGIFGSFLDFHL